LQIQGSDNRSHPWALGPYDIETLLAPVKTLVAEAEVMTLQKE